MNDPTKHPGTDLDSRRPIAARNTHLAARVARVLTRAGISPNAISLTSIAFALAGGRFDNSRTPRRQEAMGQNLVAAHPTAEHWAELDAAIARRVQELLQPVLVAMTPAAKKSLVKMGDGSEAFCRKALEVMEENAALIPRGFDLSEMRRDLATHDALYARVLKLTQLLEHARNAEMALGSDVMVSALEGYAVLKAVGKGDGVEALKKLLSKRFAVGPREAKAPAA